MRILHDLIIWTERIGGLIGVAEAIKKRELQKCLAVQLMCRKNSFDNQTNSIIFGVNNAA
jgi:hypothetical protein